VDTENEKALLLSEITIIKKRNKNESEREERWLGSVRGGGGERTMINSLAR
jgi:hypothetical protein